MKRLFPIAALAVLAALTFPAMTSAQSSHFRVTYVNLTPQCVWMTFYAGNQDYFIEQGDARPRMVHPYKTISFAIEKKDNVRMRNEIMYTCSGGGGHRTHDTQFSNDANENLRRFNAVKYELHRNFSNGRYWLTAVWSH